MFSVHQVNLQNPMPLLSFLVERTHRQMTIRVNVKGYFVIGDSLVGKLPNQRPAIGPPNFQPNCSVNDCAWLNN